MRVSILILSLIVTFFIVPKISSAELGPTEWEQYRLYPDKNAVYTNEEVEPLKPKVFETNDEIRATPVVIDNRMFVGNHNSGDLFAFDLNSGEKLWENEAPNWIHSEMIFQDGQLYVGYGNRFFQDNGIRGTEESGVLSLDAESGEIVWQYETEGEVMPTPVYENGSVYAVTGDRYLYSLDQTSGELNDQTSIGSVVSMSAPNKTDNTLYFGGSGPEPFEFTAFDIDSGEIKWQTEFPSVFAGLDDVPAASADGIIVTTALQGDAEEPEHMIYAMDQETGEVLWEDSLGKGDFVKNNKSGAPIIYNGSIYVGSPITKKMYAYDLKSGEKQWEYEDEVMKAPPVAKDDVVYFANTKGLVQALDAESGEKQGEIELGGTLAPSGPIIMNDTLMIGSQDSRVYAVPTEDILDEEIETFASLVDSETDGPNDESSNQMMYILAGGLFFIVLLGILLKTKFKKERTQ
ncbi:hypothetical protein GCM10010954_32740 [Halobacillus andaensis]|uniref:Pyrrolo-quinoline quinone repeat domain-containing protein n=1 Tax=Halobacillus andaensis TaxID=1176239 RepID=A0A917EXG4_HALAA|nr:PQQ-binding-like beta-propeller repeat protein [Halobacillus andaensis]MBP2005379.1 outer membrane protein assembly factor BamB [Halobacillus andaensis]GGF31029.1 hypothetical protein GCM10010954_32740 [Halobacillus andaensis]